MPGGGWKIFGGIGLLLALLGAGLLCLRRSEDTVAGIEIFKARRELRLVDARGHVIQVYAVALGTEPVAPKQVEGDGATPEGTYFICRKNPRSRFTLSLGISYPGPQDAARGREAGLISAEEARAIRDAHARGEAPPWKTRLGGEIFIHGGGVAGDWTQGCVALDDADMKALYDGIPLGTPVRVFP